MRLRVTSHISAALEASGEPPSAQRKWISHKELIELARGLPDPWNLRGLLRGTSVYTEPPSPPAPKTKEFIQHMEKIRNDVAEREYQELISRPNDKPFPVLDPREVKDTKEQLTTIVNIIVSIVSVGFALWYWSSSFSDPSRVLLAVFGSIATAFAEVVVYMGYRRRIDEAREIENPKTSSVPAEKTATPISSGSEHTHKYNEDPEKPLRRRNAKFRGE